MLRVLLWFSYLFAPSFGVVCPTDITGPITGIKDGYVTVEDVLMVLENFGSSTKYGDVDRDGSVGVEDVLTVLKDYGRSDCDKPVTVLPIPIIPDYCKHNRLQMCKSMCPLKNQLQGVLQCKSSQCFERVGTCCQFKCRDLTPNPTYPSGCILWYDGCNTCSISSNKLSQCTNLACFVNLPPYCKRFTNGTQCKSHLWTSCTINKPIEPGPGDVVIGRPFLYDGEILMSKPVYSDWDL